jgi:hypothetical protein
MEALVEDLLGAPYRSRWRLVIEVGLGALRENLRPTVVKDDRRLRPAGVDLRAAWTMQHREGLLRRRIGAPAESYLEPGEDVVASFDGRTSWPIVGHVAFMAPLITLGTIIGTVLPVGSEPRLLFHVTIRLVVGATVWAASRCWLLVTHSHRMTFVATTHGLLVFQNGLFNRPKALQSRTAALAPQLVRSGRAWRQVQLGDELVWVHRSSDPVLRWMAGQLAFGLRWQPLDWKGSSSA